MTSAFCPDICPARRARVPRLLQRPSALPSKPFPVAQTTVTRRHASAKEACHHLAAAGSQALSLPTRPLGQAPAGFLPCSPPQHSKLRGAPMAPARPRPGQPSEGDSVPVPYRPVSASEDCNRCQEGHRERQLSTLGKPWSPGARQHWSKPRVCVFPVM